MRTKPGNRATSAETKAHHRLSLGSTSAYAGHLSSLVFGKIKSLWTAQASTANSGLNQLAGTHHSTQYIFLFSNLSSVHFIIEITYCQKLFRSVFVLFEQYSIFLLSFWFEHGIIFARVVLRLR